MAAGTSPKPLGEHLSPRPQSPGTDADVCSLPARSTKTGSFRFFWSWAQPPGGQPRGTLPVLPAGLVMAMPWCQCGSTQFVFF